MAEEYGLANLLAGQSIPADDSGLGQIYGGGDSYAAEPQAPSSPAIPPGYRPVPLPSGGYIYAYKDHSDEQAIAAFEAQQGAQHPQHKPIPQGHAATQEPVAPEFKQAQRQPRYEAFDPISEVLNAENQLDRASIEEIPRAYKYALTPSQAAKAKSQEEAAALAAQPRDPERQGFVPALGAGFAREIGSVGRFASESAQPFAPGVAQTIKEITQPVEAKAKELHQPISDIEIAEAKQKGFLPYAKAQLTHAGDVLGGFAGEWGAPSVLGMAGKVGKTTSAGLTFAQLYGDLSRRAEEEGVALSLPEKYAGAAISTAIFQLAPNFITKGIPIGVLAPSAKTIVDIYEKEGVEAAQNAVGSIAGNIIKSYGTGVAGGTAAMAGTEAVTRHMLGQPQLSLEDVGQMAKDAAIISAPMSILHGRAATTEARAGFNEAAARDYRDTQRLQQQVEGINRENAERVWPEMRTEGRDQAPPTTEPFATPGVAPAEPAPPTGEVNLLQPVDWHPVGDGYPNTVEGLKSFIAHHKDKMQSEVARRNPEVAAPIEAALLEANKRLRALRGTAQKKAPPEPTGIPPSAETFPWPVEAATPEAPIAEAPPEPVTPEAPAPVEPVTPEAPAAPWPVEALGLKPNAALTKRLAKLDMNNPEHIEAISDELNKTRVQIEPEKLAALSNHFDAIKPKEAPSAEQIPEAGAPDGGSSAQPILREEGGDQTISGEGVEPSGQGEQAAEVKAPEEITAQSIIDELEPEDQRTTFSKMFQRDITGTRSEIAAYRLNEFRDQLERAEWELGMTQSRVDGYKRPPKVWRDLLIEDQARVDALRKNVQAYTDALPELNKRDRADASKEMDRTLLRDAHDDLDDAVEEGMLTRAQANEIKKMAWERGDQLAASQFIEGALDAAEDGYLTKYMRSGTGQEVITPKAEVLKGAPGEIQAPGKVAVPEKVTPEGAEAWKKAFEAQRKSKQQQEDEALIRKIESDEYAEPDEDGDPGELFFSLGEPTPKEELVDRAIRRLIHKEETGQDIWVPGMGNRQVQATLRNLLTQRDAGKITEEQMHSQLNDLLDQITIKAAEKRLKGAPRVRGADFIRQRLLEAKRKGLVTDRAADMAEWFIKKNPALIEDLGISIKGEAPKGDDVTAGFYDKANRVFTLIAENAKDTTSIHETLHHLERMMPANIRAGIAKAWTRSLTKARDKALKAGDEPTVNFFNAALTGDARATKKALEGLSREQLGEHYQHFSPSEFWAVNGARILENRYNSSPAFLKRLGTWLREFGQHVKGTLGLKSDAPILRAIDTMLKEKAPEYRAERLLAEETGKQDAQFLASQEPREEGERERPPLTKVDRSSTLKTVANTLKRAAMAIGDPSIMSEEYAKFRRRVIAESAGLTKALESEPTYDPDTGIRVDYLRNQYDSAYQLSLEGLFNGVPVAEPKTGLVRIQPTTRTNLDRIMVDAAKLPLKVSYDGKKKAPLEVMGDIFRIKMGEQELQEYEEAKTKLRTMEQLPEATLRRADAQTEMSRLKELISNQERGIGRERNVTREDIRWANEELQRVPGAQDILDRWGETNQELLRFARDTNWITPEKYEEWSQRPSYIPMYKPMEDILAERGEVPAFPGGGPKTVGKLFGKTGASSAFPVNVFESMSQHYTSMLTNSMMNNVKYRAFQQLEKVGLAERVPPTYKGKDAVKARAAGKDFLYKVKDEEAFRSLTMANMYSNPFLDLVAVPANLIRRTALFLNPAYYYRTMIHDPLAATLTTTAKGALGPVTPADALYQLGKRIAGLDKSAKDLQYYGISGLANMDANMHRFARAMGDSPKYSKWLQYIDKIHSSFDDATRTIVYEAAKKEAAKQGITDPQVINDIAAVKARDFADFAAKGSSQLIRMAGKQTPFLHAHFVGLDKMLRAATGHGKDSKEAKAQRDRFIAGATIASSAVVAITLANIQDKRYRDLPIGEWSKNLIAGFDDEGRAIKIPVPQEIGFWFKFVPELATRMLMGVSDKPEASKAFHGMAIDTLLPPGLADPVSIAVRGYLQLQTNTELHSGLPIESPQEQLLLPEDRDKRATIFSKTLRDKLKKYGLAEDFSPDKFDSLMRAYFTTLYDNSALAAAMIHDASTGKRGLFELPFNKDFTEVYPGAKAFYSNPRNISATPRFYDMTKPLYETLKSVNAAAHGERDDSVERFEELRNDPVVMQRYRMAKVAAKYRSKISALEKAIEQLDKRQDLNTAQKRKLYWDRIKDRNELARTAVEELSKGLMQDKQFKDDVEKSWKISVSPEDLERQIGTFKQDIGDTEE